MKGKLIIALYFSLFLSSNVGIASAATYSTKQISDNSYDDYYPQINNNDIVVWQGDNEVFLYNGSTSFQISDNGPVGDTPRPQINDSGYVVWRGFDSDWEQDALFLYDGSDSAIITHSFDMGEVAINESNHLVWESDSEIFFYDGVTIFRITNNSYIDTWFVLNENDYIAWRGYDGSDYEIYLYNGEETSQITDNDYDDGPPELNDYGNVVWEGSDGSRYDIYLYNGSDIIKITESSYTGSRYYPPQINNDGHIVWNADSQIYMYDGSDVIQLSSGDYGNETPQLNEYGHVAWKGYDGTSQQLFLYDGVSTSQITENDDDVFLPVINNNDTIVYYMNKNDNLEIFLTNASGSESDTDSSSSYSGDSGGCFISNLL